jgi:HEAT repeat protein
VRIHAAYALTQAGDTGAKALIKAFNDNKDGEARVQIMQALLYSPARPHALPLIKQAIKDPNRNVRIHALQLLPNLGQTQEVADILADAIKEKDLDTRVAAAQGLQNFGPKGMPVLEQQLPSAKESVLRLALLQGMINHNHRSKAMVGTLTEYLKDGQPQVRWQTAQVLANQGEDARDAVPMLKELLNDTDPTVRQQAQLALGRIAPPKQ